MSFCSLLWFGLSTYSHLLLVLETHESKRSIELTQYYEIPPTGPATASIKPSCGLVELVGTRDQRTVEVREDEVEE